LSSCTAKTSLVVEERKTGDEVVKTIKSGRNQVLGVVTEQFHGGKHGKTSMLELGKRALLSLRSVKVWLAAVEVTEETVVVNGADEEEHLGPAKGRDGIDCSNTMWDIGEGKAWGDLTRPTEHLWDDVAEDAKLCNTAVL
jgi:hypothetical protein